MRDGLGASLARDVRVQHPAAPRCADDQAENTMSTNTRAVLYSAIAWVMAASAQLPAQAQPTDAETDAQVHTLQAVTIKAERKPEQAQAEQALQTVAGNTALVDNEQVERGRAASAEDVLAFQPGVFAQSTSGNAAAKISIRGSGLNTFYGGYVLGTKFLFDGLPITGPGGTQEDLLSIAGVNYTEVLYGANAFQYAATSLGGAINFVTHTGQTSPGTYLRVEGGSYGYRKQQISNGGVAGNFDWYVSLLHNSRDGYQDLTDTNGRELVANLGYRFGPRLDTRLLLRYREEELINGGTLTLAQINSGSRANPAPYGRKKGGTTLVGSKTTYVFDDDARLELGVDLNNYPLYNSWRYSTTPNLWRSTDINTSVRYLRSGDTLFGRNLDTSVTWSDTRLAFGDARTHDRDSWRLLKEVRYTGSRDTVLALGGELQLDASSWLSAGVSLINIDRDVRVVQSTTANTSVYPQRYALDTWYAAPRLGLRYRLTPDLQAFANVSRSIDPPVTWQISGGGVATPFARPLVPQKATTAEAGVRGSHGIFDGSLTVYRSWINDELLTVVTQQATASTDAVVANANAGPTVHQGIEASLSTRVWDGDDGSGLSLRQAYTLNDFHYRRDAAFAQNALPGLPRQVYQAELQYAHGSGFYAHLDVRAASSYYVDFANTLKAPGYGLLGAKLGYGLPSGRWSAWVDLRNLANKHYATATSTAYDLQGRDSNVFYVGDGFSVFAGASLRF
ncbi:TonB-dependent receptor [Xanthomonas citri pv. aurantifolii str. ICPB 11122]|nr:ligand-gated channel [Xanthomonas citri pv. aurantifolii]EFF43729.1 TonB-dependent receptor [Xanthomonas citri pv. aurantifolii str. ICPB 11122]